MKEAGWGTGLGVEYRIRDRLGLRVDGTLERMTAREEMPNAAFFGTTPSPDARLWHLTGQLEVELTEPPGPAEIALSTGGGFTWFDIDAFDEFEAIEETALTWTVAIFAGYQVAEGFTVFTRIQGFVMLEDEGEGEDPLGQEATIVNALGIRVDF